MLLLVCDHERDMKKQRFICVLCVIMGIGIGVGAYWICEKCSKAPMPSHEMQMPDSIRDYPLIDYYFDSNESWVIVNVSNLFTQEEKYELILEAHKIEHVKEYLFLDTIPAGRGTTPNGYLYIYKQRELVKSVPYYSCEITNQELKDAFKISTKTQIESILNQALPPVV